MRINIMLVKNMYFFIFDLWSRPWGVARLLGVPRPHPSEGVGRSGSTTTITRS